MCDAMDDAAPTPANDLLASRQLLSGRSGTVSGTLRFAGAEAGERVLFLDESYGQAGTTVWYRFVAPASGTLQVVVSRDPVDPADNQFTARVAVFREPSSGAVTFASLERVGRSPAASSAGEAAAVVVAGAAYAIQVDRDYLRDEPHDEFTLSWSLGGEGVASPRY
jgi:hypothetical protein